MERQETSTRGFKQMHSVFKNILKMETAPLAKYSKIPALKDGYQKCCLGHHEGEDEKLPLFYKAMK
jgi:hypothetical protein